MIQLTTQSQKQELKNYLLNNLEQFEHLKTFVELFPDKPFPKDFDINSALLAAISNNDFKITKYLISKKANINFMNGSPLYMAAYKNSLDTVKYLIFKGADIRLRTYGCLRAASVKGNLDIIKYLVEEQNVDVTVDKNFALRWAHAKNFTAVADYLISKGAPVELLNKKG